MSLHPDLQAYVEDDRTLPVLRHPLVFSVPYFPHEQMDEMLNKTYEAKTQAVKDAIQAQKWSTAVFLHERPYRLQALTGLQHQMPEEAFRELLKDVWIDSENIWQNLNLWKILLLPMTGQDPWQTVGPLAPELVVYRGGKATGLSWTLDHDKACWFANRFGQNLPLYQAQIRKEHLVGYLTGRGEEEIVLDPRKIVNKLRLN